MDIAWKHIVYFYDCILRPLIVYNGRLVSLLVTKMFIPRNASLYGRLNAVDLLIKVACFVEKWGSLQQSWACWLQGGQPY